MLKIALPTIQINANTRNYINALVLSGAEPETGSVIHPENCDGLLLPGGIDVNPSLFGQDKAPETEFDSALDTLQLGVLRRFMDLGKPVFGICRGHQLINVALGGTLIQHLPAAEDHMEICPGADHVHLCDAVPDSFIGRLYGTQFTVNSSHHQGVGILGKGLRPVLHAQDGVIEAMEHETLPIWSVQFHPERMCYAHRRSDTVDGSLLFLFFLEKCRKQDQ
jgi:putative glutamine amidotransferase